MKLTLDYQINSGRRFGRIGKWLRRSVIAAVVMAAVFYSYRTAKHRIAGLYQCIGLFPIRAGAWNQCASFAYPPDTLLFDESTDAMLTDGAGRPFRLVRPNASMTLQHGDGLQLWNNPSAVGQSNTVPPGSHWDIGRNAPPPSPWQALEKVEWTLSEKLGCGRWSVFCLSGLRPFISFNGYCGNEVFASGRRAAGRRRLVQVSFNPVAYMGGSPTPFRSVVLGEPSNWRSLARTNSPTAPRDSALRFPPTSGFGCTPGRRTRMTHRDSRSTMKSTATETPFTGGSARMTP